MLNDKKPATGPTATSDLIDAFDRNGLFDRAPIDLMRWFFVAPWMFLAVLPCR